MLGNSTLNTSGLLFSELSLSVKNLMENGTSDSVMLGNSMLNIPGLLVSELSLFVKTLMENGTSAHCSRSCGRTLAKERSSGTSCAQAFCLLDLT